METKETKNCPYCGEEILAVAKKCKHCGEWLTEEPRAKKVFPCPVCGEDVEEGTAICPHCNEPIKKKKETSNLAVQSQGGNKNLPKSPKNKQNSGKQQPTINVNVNQRRRKSDDESSFDKGFGGAMGGCTGVLAFFMLLGLLMNKCSKSTAQNHPEYDKKQDAITESIVKDTKDANSCAEFRINQIERNHNQ